MKSYAGFFPTAEALAGRAARDGSEGCDLRVGCSKCPFIGKEELFTAMVGTARDVIVFCRC